MLPVYTPKSPNQRGFSLVEMIITIAVIAIIAGISVPIMQNVFERGQDTAARRNAQAIEDDDRDKTFKYLEFKDGKLAFDPDN